VLDPASLGINLFMLALIHGDDIALLIENDAACAGGSLINRTDKLLRTHGILPLNIFL
jgi:hypothetical protein